MKIRPVINPVEEWNCPIKVIKRPFQMTIFSIWQTWWLHHCTTPQWPSWAGISFFTKRSDCYWSRFFPRLCPVFKKKSEVESKEQAIQESHLMILITFCIHLSASFKPSCAGESIILASALLQAGNLWFIQITLLSPCTMALKAPWTFLIKTV